MKDYQTIFKTYMFEIKRDGIEDLDEFIDIIGFYTASASSSNHMATNGGLVEHSVNVCETALKIANTLNYKNRESVILTSLFHDLGKASYFNKPNYVENKLKSGKLGSKPYTVNKLRTAIPHEMASIHMLSKFIQLTEEETNAIYFHNGMYVGSSRELKGNERPLQMILHFADMWASRCIEQTITEYNKELF